jgi:ELWxxDGT repeat protein
MFSASSGSEGLFVSDGTDAGTALVTNSDGKKFEVYDIEDVDGKAILAGRYKGLEDVGVEMFTYDPVAGGEATIVQDLNPTPYAEGYSSTRSNHVKTSNGYYFVAQDGSHGYELWKMSSTTGMAERVLNGGFSVYPNPVRELLTIDLKADSYEILDLSGRVLLRSADAGINVSTLATGIYLVRAMNADGVSLTKFVKL